MSVITVWKSHGILIRLKNIDLLQKNEKGPHAVDQGFENHLNLVIATSKSYQTLYNFWNFLYIPSLVLLNYVRQPYESPQDGTE